jgi:hypothetical protein
MVTISAPDNKAAGATLILQSLFCSLYMLKPVLLTLKEGIPLNEIKNIST